jgi:hypothetical protein
MKTRSAKSRSRKQKRQRTRRHRNKQKGGGNTFSRNIPSEAVIVNPIFESREEVSIV